MFGSRRGENQKSRPTKSKETSRTERVFTENRRRPPKETDEKKTKRPQRRVAIGPKLPTAKRIAKAAVRLMFAALVTGGVLLLGVLAYRHATESDYFAFQTLNLTGNKRLTDAQIAETAGLIEGKNIFKIDLAKAKHALIDHPWIVDADISRRLPGLVNVSIVEREAVALVNFDVLYLVDNTGQVFKRWVRGDPIPAPVITGISREHYIEDPKQMESVLCDAIDLANRYKEGGLEKLAPLDEIHREPSGGFSLTVGTDPVYVRFGKGPYRTKLGRLSTLIGRLTREGKRPETIFFDNDVRPDRITVKLKNDEESANAEPANGSVGDGMAMLKK